MRPAPLAAGTCTRDIALGAGALLLALLVAVERVVRRRSTVT